MCGGEEKLNSEFPEMKPFLEVLSKEDNGKGNGFEDMVYINDVRYDAVGQSLYLKQTVSTENPAAVVMINTELCTKAGNSLGRISHTESDAGRFSYWYRMGDVQPEQIGNGELCIHVVMSWAEKETGRLGAIEVKDKYPVWTDTNVKEIMLQAPTHCRSQKDDFIKVVYNRMPQWTETADYIYNCEPVAQGQPLYLDCGGEVMLDGKVFSELYGYQLLLDSYRGAALYQKEDGLSVEKTNDGFRWSFLNDWNNYVPSRRLPIQDPVEFRLRLSFYCEGEETPDTVLICSDLEEDEKTNKKN